MAVASLAALFVGISSASASVMTYRGTGLGEVVSMHAPGHLADGLSVIAGQDLLTYENAELTGFCVDIDQYAGTSEVTETAATDLHNGYLVAYLVEKYGMAATTNQQAAAVQLAIWEVLYEPAGHGFNVTTGDLSAVNCDSSLATAANLLLADLPETYESHSIRVLATVTSQDFVIVPARGAVPEPAILALLTLGGVGLLRRRTNQTCRRVL